MQISDEMREAMLAAMTRNTIDSGDADALIDAVAPLILKEAAKIAREQYDEAPSGSYDNGGTQDGWQMACRKVEELIIALTVQKPPHGGVRFPRT